MGAAIMDTDRILPQNGSSPGSGASSSGQPPSQPHAQSPYHHSYSNTQTLQQQQQQQGGPVYQQGTSSTPGGLYNGSSATPSSYSTMGHNIRKKKTDRPAVPPISSLVGYGGTGSGVNASSGQLNGQSSFGGSGIHLHQSHVYTPDQQFNGDQQLLGRTGGGGGTPIMGGHSNQAYAVDPSTPIR